MNIFMDEEDPQEPILGMPEALPEGERIIWQGRPSALALAINAFRMRWIIAYFAVMTIFRLANASTNGAGTSEMTGILVSSIVFALIAAVLVYGLSFAMSRAAVFTITDHRVIFRYGAAIRKHVNIPFSQIKGASLTRKSARIGDIALELSQPGKPPYLHLWPFARPFKYGKPQPMMRGIEQAERVSRILADAVRANAPEKVEVELGRESEPPRPNITPEPSVSAA